MDIFLEGMMHFSLETKHQHQGVGAKGFLNIDAFIFHVMLF